MARISARCQYVKDGDTFQTARGRWIRLAYVYAPEKGERGYLIAKRILESLILGKAITYKPVGTSYGRIVAEVWVGRTYVNGYMIAQGYSR